MRGGIRRARLRFLFGTVMPMLALLLPGELPAGEETVRSSVRAHLQDGSMVDFPQGFRVRGSGTAMRIEGEAHEAVRRGAGGTSRVAGLPVDQIFALEVLDSHSGDRGEPAPVAVRPRSAASSYRSSPALYTVTAGTPVLEAEAFSNSLMRLVQEEDLDRIRVSPVADGTVEVLAMNGALETHHVDKLLLERVDHPPSMVAWPTRRRETILLGSTAAIGSARSKDGREVAQLLATEDGLAYRTDPAVTRELAQSITQDWIEFEVDVPPDARTAYLALRIRNTLFNAILMDEALLRGRGFQAVDLIAGARFRPLEVWKLYRWCKKHLGLRIEVGGGRSFKQVDRIGGTGPLAWRSVGVAVPVDQGRPVQIRLSFLADTWMVDYVAVSFEGRTVGSSQVRAPEAVRCTDGREGAPHANRLARADGHYFTIGAGSACRITFRDLPHPAPERRTYFLRSEGYFTKWIKQDLLVATETAEERASRSEPAVQRAASKWIRTKKAIEQSIETEALISPDRLR